MDDPKLLEVLARVRSMLGAHPYGFLVTAGLRGSVSSRLVQHATVEEDLSIWIGTSPSSRKATEVANDPASAYSVEDRASFGAVTLVGRASLEDDLGARRRAWASGFEAFFPNGYDGSGFVAIRLVPDRFEVIDFGNGIHPNPYGLASLHVMRQGSGWSVVSPGPSSGSELSE